MCIVALAIAQHPRLPVVIAANRDEFHARPARAAAPWAEDAAVVGGRDLEAGGSWLAVHRSGRYAVVTNFRQPGATRGACSRGALVHDFVRGATAPSEYVETLRDRRHDYAPFNLVVGDARAAWWLESISGRHDRFEPGTHAFSNGPVLAPWPKCQGVAASLKQALRVDAPDTAALMAALADTSVAANNELPDTGVGIELERLLSPIHIVGDRYGTRASTLLALDQDGAHRLLERRFGPNGTCEGESAWSAIAEGWTAIDWPSAL
jgi:uncharacterized protein with NRDE domain